MCANIFNKIAKTEDLYGFNDEGVVNKELYESLQGKTPQEQSKLINVWIKSKNPNARLSYVDAEGKLRIPHIYLFYKQGGRLW